MAKKGLKNITAPKKRKQSPPKKKDPPTIRQKERKPDDRASKEELRRRRLSVVEWILADHATSTIENSCMATWDVSRRQAQRYIFMARKYIELSDQQSIDQRRRYYLARKMKLIRDMDPREKKTASGAAAINRILDSMAELEGIKKQKIEISGEDGKPIETVLKVETNVDYALLPDNVLEHIINARVKQPVT